MKIIWIIIAIILAIGAVWFFIGMPGFPKPSTDVIEVTSFPKSITTRESFAITWQINNPKSLTIPHTAIHYGPEPKDDISYPGFTPEFNQGSFSIPNVFSAVITVPEISGKLYFRAHAVIENEDIWTEEMVIEIPETRIIQPTVLPTRLPQESIEVPEVLQEPEELEEPKALPAPEVPVQELPLPSSQLKIQEFDLEQSVYPGYFSPNPLIVKKDIPVKLLVTTKQREHINRISIQPWISSSDTLSPGKVTIIEFTPDQVGEFKIRNIGHGFEGILKVVE